MPWNLPNLLTWGRVLLIPVLMLFFFLPGSWSNWACLAVFILASVTDWLDGLIARRLGQTSPFGAFLDPVADKLMISTALILLLQRDPGVLLALPVVVIIGREITISALREWMAEIGERARVQVAWLGKVKTIAQMIAIGVLLVRERVFGLPVYEIGLVLLYIAMVLTLWSMARYLKAAWPLMR